MKKLLIYKQSNFLHIKQKKVQLNLQHFFKKRIILDINGFTKSMILLIMFIQLQKVNLSYLVHFSKKKQTHKNKFQFSMNLEILNQIISLIQKNQMNINHKKLYVKQIFQQINSKKLKMCLMSTDLKSMAKALGLVKKMQHRILTKQKTLII